MASLFHSVGKYRKLWITILMGLSMITFVLCAGNQADPDKWLLRFFGGRGGDVAATINGVNIYKADLDRVKIQRNAANIYIKSLINQLVEVVSDRQKNLPEKLDDEMQKRFNQVLQLRAILMARMHSSTLFDTGVKSEELIDFLTWLAEADRLGVTINDEELRKLIAYDTNRYAILNNIPNINAAAADQQMQRIAEQKVYELSRDNPIAALRTGLIDEYKVRMAKLAAIEFQLSTYARESPKRVRPNNYMPSELTRLALTPAQLYDYYSDNRTELDAELLAIPVESFVAQVGKPDDHALETLFTAYKTKPYDPAKAEPGFMNQHVMKVKWVTGDPSSPFFKTVAKTANALAAFPILQWTPQMPLADGIRLAAGQAVYDARIAMEYNLQNRPLFMGLAPNYPFAADNMDPAIGIPMANFLAYKDPIAKIAVIGALARPDSVFAAVPLFAANGLVKNKELIQEGIRIEVKRRVPMYASIVGAGATGPLMPLMSVGVAVTEPTLLPLPIVRDSIAEVLERQQASPWVTANALFLKKLMEDEKVMGDELQMKRLLDRFGPDYAKASEGRQPNRNLGLEVGETKKFFGKYDAETDPELKPLREAFDHYFQQINMIEGRDGITGKQPWKESDFPKIFFEGTENVGLAGEQRKFAVRPWPPTLSLGNPTQLEMMLQMQSNRMGLANMDAGAMDEFNSLRTSKEPTKNATLDMIAYAEKPILFWKTAEQLSTPPQSVADVKDRVTEAWKRIEARDKLALPYAQKIAEGLLKGNAQYRTALSLEGKDKGAKMIELTHIAKLAQTTPANPFGGGGATYGPFQIHGELKYPREDTVPNLLALYGLKEPIKIGVPDIDNVNAALFAEAQKANRGAIKYVQILTNQPRDTFYVAVLDGMTPVGWGGLGALLREGATGRDSLLDRAQAKRGDEFMTTFVQQLRERFKVKVFEAAKSVDNEAPGV
jgi:hypothetical protein